MEERILTETGTSEPVVVFGEKVQTVEITIAGYTSSCTLAVEGFIKNGWVTLDEDGDTTFTAGGTYIANVVDVKIEEIRLNWKSGTATSITAVFDFQ